MIGRGLIERSRSRIPTATLDGILTIGDTLAINTGVANDDYFTIGAVDNDTNTITELMRFVGASTPYIQITSNQLWFSDSILKRDFAGSLSLRNLADNAYTNLYLGELNVFSLLSMRDTTAIKTGTTAADYFDIEARKTDATAAFQTVARIQSHATDTYIGLGGSQEFKFYNSGVADFGAITLGGTVSGADQTFDAGGGIFKIATTGTQPLKLEATHDGAIGCALASDHISTSIAVGDRIFELLTYGKDAGAVTIQYARESFILENVTATTEACKVEWWMNTGGNATPDNLAMTLSSAGDLWIDGGITSSKLNFKAEADLTIASDAIAVTQTYHSIITQGGADDDLATATGGSEGNILILKANTSGTNGIVTVKNGTGANTFILSGGADFILDHIDDRIMLIHNGTEWVEISRSSNS